MRGKKKEKKNPPQLFFLCDLLPELNTFSPDFQEVMETEGKTLTVLGQVHLLTGH